MKLWTEPTDIHVTLGETRYKIRRVTRGWRFWSQSPNGDWKPILGDHTQLHTRLIDHAIDQGLLTDNERSLL